MILSNCVVDSCTSPASIDICESNFLNCSLTASILSSRDMQKEMGSVAGSCFVYLVLCCVMLCCVVLCCVVSARDEGGFEPEKFSPTSNLSTTPSNTLQTAWYTASSYSR